MVQAIQDLKLPEPASFLKPAEKALHKHLIEDAATWLFCQKNPNFIFSAKQVCERLGMDRERMAQRVFATLTSKRRKEIVKAIGEPEILASVASSPMPELRQAAVASTD